MKPRNKEKAAELSKLVDDTWDISLDVMDGISIIGPRFPMPYHVNNQDIGL